MTVNSAKDIPAGYKAHPGAADAKTVFTGAAPSAAFKEWPKWMYGPKGESQVFNRVEDVPRGWQDHPSKFDKRPAPSPKQVDDTPPAGEGGEPAKDDDGIPDDLGGMSREEIELGLQRRNVSYKSNSTDKTLYRKLQQAIADQS